MAVRFDPDTALFFMLAVVVLLVFGVFIYAAVDAMFAARRSAPAFVLRDYNRWYVYLIFIVFSLGYPSTYADIIRSEVFQPFKIPSASMAPSIMPGDFLVLNKFIYKKHPPRRGDIVIFRNPNDPSRHFMKRIVAMPGDTIEIRQGRALVNGSPLAVEAAGSVPPAWANGQQGAKVLEHADGAEYWTMVDETSGGDFPGTTVPNGHCFVLGDNRSHSVDSREFGCVPLSELQGRAE